MLSTVAQDFDTPTRPHEAISRADLRARVVSILTDLRIPWAWQGPLGAAETWDGESSAADLDIWWQPTATEKYEALMRMAGVSPFAVVARSTDPKRLRHLSLAFEIDHALAVVDFTEGDLRVGAILTWPAAEVQVTVGPDGSRLTGCAGAADLLVRPLLRGKQPVATRVAEAQSCWREASESSRREAAQLWGEQLGPVADQIIAVLAGAEVSSDLPRAARRVLLRRTLAPSGLRASWAQRWTVVPAGRSAGPLDLRTRGVVVALVGTDGSGKSTVAADLATRLEALGFTTSSAYFGMARGNLPGVGLARRLLGVKSEPEVPLDEGEPSGTGPGTTDSSSASQPVQSDLGGTAAAPDVTGADDNEPKPLSHPGLRRIAAWFYAAEYGWRYASKVAPQVRKRHVVICDRYVYDLRDSPWPGSPASKVAEALVPAPDVLLLPDAPAAMIHARKPERPEWEQAKQQAEFAALLSERPARVAELILDTSGQTQDAVAAAVAAVVQAAHLPRGTARE